MTCIRLAWARWGSHLASPLAMLVRGVLRLDSSGFQKWARRGCDGPSGRIQGIPNEEILMLDYSSERPQPVKTQSSPAVATDIKAVHDNLAQMTTVITQLSNVVVALRDQVAKLDAELAEVRPQLSAFKVHIDSFPNAL